MNSRGIGKTFETAVFKSLREELSSDRGMPFVGGFQGLDDPDEETWRQIEPPSMIFGRSLFGNTKLDFILFHPIAGPAAIEKYGHEFDYY